MENNKSGTLYFDGAITSNPGGKASGGMVLYIGKKLVAACGHCFGEGDGWTCNTAEYEALLRGMRVAVTHRISHLKVFGDSKLIINTVSGKWKVKSPSIKEFRDKCRSLETRFESVCYEWIPRCENVAADAYSKFVWSQNEIEDDVERLSKYE